MGSTSFWRFSYPNLLLVFLKKKTTVSVIDRVPVYKIIVSLINPDFEKQKKQKFVVGRSRTTVNAIVRVSIYHNRLYNDGTHDLARFARGF